MRGDDCGILWLQGVLSHVPRNFGVGRDACAKFISAGIGTDVRSCLLVGGGADHRLKSLVRRSLRAWAQDICQFWDAAE